MTQPPDANQPPVPPDPFAPPPPPGYPSPYGTPPPPPGYAGRPYGYPAPPPPPGYAGRPYGYPAPPPPGYAPAAAPGTDGMAIAAIICAFLCSLLGLILGIVALSRIKKSQRGGRGLAIAAIIISCLSMVSGVAFVALAAARVGRSASGTVAATDLRSGDCINYPTGGITVVQSFDAVACSAPHDGEVYANGTLTLTGTWPGTAAVTNATQDQCRIAFLPFVGISLASSTLTVAYFYPLEANWSAGDRGYVCVVGGTGKTTGTLQGAAR